jgi:hypothetical protein|eukprot:SAG25_NODE_1326_length_3285_cov_1.715945_2_plen_46_part_00
MLSTAPLPTALKAWLAWLIKLDEIDAKTVTMLEKVFAASNESTVA